MKRLCLTAFGEPPEVFALEPLPNDLKAGAGEVVVTMEAASINPSDLRLSRGTYGLKPSLPFPMGAEGVGRVSDIGAGVSEALAGKRVIIVPNGKQGTWAEKLVTQAQNVVPTDEHADAKQLAMLGINPATAYLMLKHYGHLMPGDWIAQTAANSAVGQNVISLAKLAGLKTLNVVRSAEAAAQVREFAGDRVLIQDDTLKQGIEDALEGEQLSLILDPVGGKALGSLVESLNAGGTIVAFANQSGEQPLFEIRDFIFRGLELQPFWLTRWLHSAPAIEITNLYKKLSKLAANGLSPAVVEQVYPLDQFKEAITHALKSGRGGKILFEFNS